MNKAGEKDKSVRDGESGGGKKSKRANTGRLKGAKQLRNVDSEKENTGEVTGVTEKKQKTKKRGKEQEMNRGDGAVVGMKKAKLEKTGSDEDGQTAKEESKGERDYKAPTASKYKVLDAMLDSSLSTLIEDAKALLSEVETMQASADQKTCRAETEKEKNETDECSPAESALDREGMKEKKNRPVCKEEEREEENSCDEHAVWVQCSRADCGKWRKLSGDVDPSVLPENWICENNSDPAFGSCSVPEEQSSMCEEEVFFCSLVPGSLVWAWQSGHPWWPAMIERDPDTDDYLEFHKKTDLAPYKCHVTYFGDPVCIDWVLCSDVRNYADLSEDEIFNMLDQPELEKKLKDAICMSKQALKLSPQMRLIMFGFWSRYDSDRENSEEDSDVADVLELFSGKSGKCSDDEYLWPKKRLRGLKEGAEEQQRRQESGSKTQGEEMNGEKKKKKVERENDKSMKKMQSGREGGNSEERGPKVTKQKAAADGLTGREETENKCFTPFFSLPRKNRSTNITEKQVQDQTVPQNAMEVTPDTRHSEGGVKTKGKAEARDEEEDREGQSQKEVKQSRQRLKRWEDSLSDEEDEEDSDGEDGFLEADSEILGCRRKERMSLSCREEEEEEDEEEQSDFTLMLLEEE